MSKKFIDINLKVNFPNPVQFIPKLLRDNESKLDFLWKNITNLIPIDDHHVSSISYSQVIRYFVLEKPDNSAISKGAILVEKHSQGYLVTQVFLDSKNNLVCAQNGTPYGRRLIANDIDDELQDTLGDKNLIIVE